MSQAESIVNSLPNIVQFNQSDALVIDCVNFYAELGAIQLGIPYIHVSAAMHFDYSGHTPLLFSIRVAKACLSLHHPRRTKHGTGISSVRSSASGHPGGL
jgi:hypothetical protein